MCRLSRPKPWGFLQCDLAAGAGRSGERDWSGRVVPLAAGSAPGPSSLVALLVARAWGLSDLQDVNLINLVTEDPTLEKQNWCARAWGIRSGRRNMEGPPEQLWSKGGEMHTSPSGHKESPSSDFMRHSEERPAQARLSVVPLPVLPVHWCGTLLTRTQMLWVILNGGHQGLV